MSGGVHNVLVQNVEFGDSRQENYWHGIFVKSKKSRGGWVRDIIFRNISTPRNVARELMTPFLTVTMAYGSGGSEPIKPAKSPPYFRNITFEEIVVFNTAQVGEVSGLGEDAKLISGIHFNSLHAENYDKGLVCSNATGITLVKSDVPAVGCISSMPELVI
eukprot:TRINITY_DN20520_c0_g1_i1.p1 TRINITY_DN20520_c0_g1~~TRINITY_DN20520_c0_g1_i1.p1  ORF type:complete len:161 (-),score=19.00 TRINITY_DN20520_c0_g1_i1:180-662(-)